MLLSWRILTVKRPLMRQSRGILDPPAPSELHFCSPAWATLDAASAAGGFNPDCHDRFILKASGA